MPSHRGHEATVNRMKKDGVITALPLFESKAPVQRNYIIIAPSVLRISHFLKQ